MSHVLHVRATEVCDSALWPLAKSIRLTRRSAALRRPAVDGGESSGDNSVNLRVASSSCTRGADFRRGIAATRGLTPASESVTRRSLRVFTTFFAVLADSLSPPRVLSAAPPRARLAPPAANSRQDSRALCLTGAFGLTTSLGSDPGGKRFTERPPIHVPARCQLTRSGSPW